MDIKRKNRNIKRIVHRSLRVTLQNEEEKRREDAYYYPMLPPIKQRFHPDLIDPLSHIPPENKTEAIRLNQHGKGIWYINKRYKKDRKRVRRKNINRNLPLSEVISTSQVSDPEMLKSDVEDEMYVTAQKMKKFSEPKGAVIRLRRYTNKDESEL